MKTKYKYIHFADSYETHEGKPIWYCHNNRSGDILGQVFYYPLWKQYCFSAEDDMCVFSADCLADIQHFLGQFNRGER